MIVSGQVEGGMGKVGDKCEYIQILVVIQEEVADYVQFGPQNAVIFALPDQAKDWGVGFCRHYTKKLADRICPPSFPFCLLMDDSVQYWRGVTLPCDPHKPFGKDAESAALRTDISLADTLLYFQNGLLDEHCDLNKFGIIGFHRLNGYESSKRAYDRTHCTSTVLLNLGNLNDKAKEVNYLEKAWVWEDLQFNRDAEEHGAVICKCYRFAFSTPQLREGGCAGMVARSEGQCLTCHKVQCACVPQSAVPCKGCQRVVAITSNERCEDCNRLEEGGSARTQPPLPLTVDEKEESVLSKMLTELNLADKYLRKLESADVTIKFLNETLAAGGRKALSEALELLGVDILLHRLEIANELQRMSSA
jgi:hypothetical protein